MQEEMHYAKQLFLYGEGTMKPVKSTKILSQMTGMSVDAIRRHTKDWRRIASEIAVMNENSPYSLSLSEETLAQHRTEVSFLGCQVEKLRIELKNIAVECQAYHVVLSSYQSALTKWEKSSGILAHYSAAEAALREHSKATAKLKAQGAGEQQVAKRKTNVSRFDVDLP